LIRRHAAVDPYTLTDQDFATLYAEAIYLEQIDEKKMTRAVLAALAEVLKK